MLRKLLIGVFAGITMLVTPTFAKGKKGKAELVTAEQVESALLWKISGKGAKESYLFGTIHMICKEDYLFSDKMTKAYKNSDVLALEINLSDPSVTMQLAMGMMAKDGKTLESYFTPEEFAQLDKMLTDKMGVSISQFNQFQPIFLMSLVAPSLFPCEQLEMYDMNLLNMAMTDSLEIVGLETIETQIAALAATPPEKIAEQVKEYLASINGTTNEVDSSALELQYMVDAYKKQDIKAMQHLVAESKGFDDNAKHKLLDERNEAWIPVIEQLIKSKKALIAVGAGHLAGPRGVVSLLRDAGYKVTPVY